ncbi:MAG: L,D-transpeptidase [Deltaproteobacteria bacterium]|nr:L,D-transpeptidase [Deltaproteobacteria bacterium]
MRPRETSCAVILLAAVFAPAALATGGSWVPPVGRTEPIRSLLVVSPGAPVRLSPHGASPRRGALARGERVPYMGEATGPGCASAWYRIDAEGYVCGALVEPSSEAPRSGPHPSLPAAGEVLPFGYGYAGMDGARIYRRAEDVEADLWESELDTGFGVAVRRLVHLHGSRFWETLSGRLIPARELRLARPSTFAGAQLESPGDIERAGWVIEREARSLGAEGRAETRTLHVRHDRVEIFETARRGGRSLLRVAHDGWLDARVVRRPRLATRPESVGAAERWIDVDLERQIVTAYEGDRPVYVTLASTGRAGTPTPTGIFRVWVKLATSTMDNFEEEEADRFYSLDDVPWVLYFDRGVALHAAFWHDRYGERRSHGCVNLSPIDARFFYEFASPVMPSGWTASFPTDRSPGTVVRVRR